MKRSKRIKKIEEKKEEKKTSPYLLLIPITIILLTFFFSSDPHYDVRRYLFGKNTKTFLYGLLLILSITLPLGLGIVKLFLYFLDSLTKLCLSLGLGFVSTFGIWAILSCLRLPLLIPILFLLNLSLAIFLLFFSAFKLRKASPSNDLKNSHHFTFPLFVFLLSYFFATTHYVDYLAPPDVDITSQGQISTYL